MGKVVSADRAMDGSDVPGFGRRILVFTGDGKGKTTAALGLVLRACGCGLRCRVVQFVKNRACGEHHALEFLPGVRVTMHGLGFVPKEPGPARDRHVRAATDGWNEALSALADPGIDMLVLDELCTALGLGLVDPSAVAAPILASKVPIVVATGRGAPSEIVGIADTVTEMRMAKHALETGVPATRGVER
jgi:cob(I)alamin adenosyltransferase